MNTRIQTITTDQNRMRQNLREVPKDSEAYTRYLKKFDDQEKEMDDLHAKLKTQQKENSRRGSRTRTSCATSRWIRKA